jgi:hypothetical protein
MYFVLDFYRKMIYSPFTTNRAVFAPAYFQYGGYMGQSDSSGSSSTVPLPDNITVHVHTMNLRRGFVRSISR